MRTLAARIAPLLLLATFVAACDDDDPAGPTPALTVAVTPTTANVVQGATQAITVTVTATTGFNEDVTLAVTGLPTGVTAPVSNQQRTNNVTTATVTLTAAATAVLGAADVTIAATATGATQDDATVNLTVAAPPAP